VILPAVSWVHLTTTMSHRRGCAGQRAV